MTERTLFDVKATTVTAPPGLPLLRAPAAPAPTSTPAKTRPKRRSHDKLSRDFERYLRDRGLPYVLIDEAKRAIFADTAVAGFDFLVYSATGPNLLVLLRWGGRFTQGDRDRMAEWESIFGPDFAAAFVWQGADGQWMMMDLRGWRASRRPLDQAV